MVGQRVPIPVSTSRRPGRHGNVLVVGIEKGRHAEGMNVDEHSSKQSAQRSGQKCGTVMFAPRDSSLSMTQIVLAFTSI